MECATFDIRTIKTIYMNPYHNEKYKARKHYMDSFLQSLGFQNIVHFQSGTYSYPQCLCDATVKILEEHIDDTPLLVLEDDIELMPGCSFTFTVPKHTDAVYLGLSRSAGHPTENRHLGDTVLEDYDEQTVLIRNMLSGHAILYVSKRYKEAIVETLKANPGIYNDVLMSRKQKDFFVFAPKIPIFYQSSTWNDKRPNEEWATKITVSGSFPPRLPSAK